MDKLSKKIMAALKNHDGYSLRDLGIKMDSSAWDLARPVAYLREQGFIEIEPNYALIHELESDALPAEDTPLRLTQKGIVALEEHTREDRRKYFNEIRAWLTLAISLFALFISILK